MSKGSIKKSTLIFPLAYFRDDSTADILYKQEAYFPEHVIRVKYGFVFVLSSRSFNQYPFSEMTYSILPITSFRGLEANERSEVNYEVWQDFKILNNIT